MKELDQLVENFFQPKRDTLGLDQLIEMVEEMMDEATGQQSERNLVAAVKNAVKNNNNQPIPLALGSMGKFDIADAESIGGGNPEPKADIVLVDSTGRKIGISMKKENFAFLQNWMNEPKLRAALAAKTTLDPAEIEIIINEIKDECKDLTSIQAKVIRAESNGFIQIAKQADPNYKPFERIKRGSKITNQIVYDALANSEGFKHQKGSTSPSSRFPVKNYYRSLQEIFKPAKFEAFLKVVVGGAPDNPNPAELVLVADINEKSYTLQQLQDIFSASETVQEVVDRYKNDPNIDIKFRLRPITEPRTTYSNSNNTKYHMKDPLHVDTELGVSWTAQVIKAKK